MARFRGRCALNPAPGVGSFRSDSSALRFLRQSPDELAVLLVSMLGSTGFAQSSCETS